MSDTEALVNSYLAAFAARDFDLARTYLADRGFSYNSPISSYNDPDRFIQIISSIGPILERMLIRKCMVSDNEAIAIIDTTLTLHGYVSYAAAMLFTVSDNRIRSIEAIFDASDYHQMFSDGG